MSHRQLLARSGLCQLLSLVRGMHVYYNVNYDMGWVRVVLTIQGGHTNVRWRPFSHTRSQDFLWVCTFSLGVHFSSPKKLTLF